MRIKTKKLFIVHSSLLILFSIFLISIFFLSGCGKKKNNPIVINNPQPVETGGLAVVLIWEDNTNKKFKAPEGVVTVRISVSAPDMDTITQDFDASLGSGKITGIPEGTNRTVTAWGLSIDGISLYTGFVVGIEIEGGKTTTVTITLSVVTGTRWQKIYGGSYDDFAYFIQQTSDGGYIVAGQTYSFGERNGDYYIIKLDADGNKIWEKIYGWGYTEGIRSIQQTNDGGYIVLGSGSEDVIKLDASGNKIWGKEIVNSNPRSIQQINDGGYIVIGYICCINSLTNIVITKIDVNGNEIWTKNYGIDILWYYIDILGGYSASIIQQTSDGGYIVGGFFSSAGGQDDFYMIKIDSNGNKVWENTYSGNYRIDNYSIQQTNDGGYIVAGGIFSSNTGWDFYVMKLDASGNKIWEKTYDNGAAESANSIQQTSDGGYIVAGSHNGYVYIIKLDASGNKIWDKIYGEGRANSIQQTSDGGYIIAGETETYNGRIDVYIIKTDSSGNTEPYPAKAKTSGISKQREEPFDRFFHKQR
jgi:hypothetical protein